MINLTTKLLKLAEELTKIAKDLQNNEQEPTSKNLISILNDFFSPKEVNAAIFIVEQEGFLLEAQDIGDGKITSGIGLTDTGRNLGDKVSPREAVKELKERMDRVELPALEKLKPVIPFKLTKNQETVLLSLMFNIGVQALRTSDAMKHFESVLRFHLTCLHNFCFIWCHHYGTTSDLITNHLYSWFFS